VIVPLWIEGPPEGENETNAVNAWRFASVLRGIRRDLTWRRINIWRAHLSAIDQPNREPAPE
jgi:glucose-6-phosphate dehydrogenase assembly protein OpcA